MTASTPQELQNHVNDALQEILGAIDPHRPLTEQGLDSISAVRLQRALQDRTTIRLPLIHFIGDVNSENLVQLLQDASAEAQQIINATPPSEHADLIAGSAASTMTPVQTMYWIGRQSDYALGGISTRFYMEHDIALDQDAPDPSTFITQLQDAWDHVVQRHGMLRATISRDGEIEITDDRQHHPLPVHAGSDAMEVRERLAHRAADLHTWPVHDIEITKTSKETLRVHLGFEVILIDFPSIMRVLTDWGRALSGTALGEETITFTEALPKTHQADIDYWAQRAPELPSGPFTADQISTVQTPVFQRHQHVIKQQHWQQFIDNAAAHGASASGALLAAAAHGLRFAGARDTFGLGTTLFVPENTDTPVGDFTRTSVVEVRNRAQTFADAASAATTELWQALDHSTVSSADIMRLRRHANSTSADELPEYPVVFTSAIGHKFAEKPWPGKMTWGVSQTPQVLIDMLHWEDEGDLVLAWDSVDEALAEGFVARAQELAVNAILRFSAPDAWTDPHLLRDPWVRPIENLQLEPPYAELREHCALLDGPMRAQVQQHPEATAVIHGKAQINRADLESQISELAQCITTTAAELDCLHADAPVLVIKQKSIDQVVAVTAVLRAGLTYIPVDPQWPLERMESIIRRSGAQMCLADADAQVPDALTHVDIEGITDSAGGAEVEMRTAAADELAYAIFTSGSTGEPKGVAIEHRAARTTIDDINERFTVGTHDVVLGLSALSFDLSVWDIFGGLGAGATLVLPEESRLRDPGYWLELCTEHGVTIWNSAPPLLEMLVDYAEIDPERAKTALQHLRLVMLSGDWIPVTLPRRLKALAPQAVVMSLGGATEASIWSICHQTEPEDEFGPSIPYGKALRAQYFRILDEQGVPVPVGQPGILHIGGDGVARGYLGDEEKTAERFITRDGERLYNTGDEGMWLPNGEIRFLGRIDRQVKINGYRIELGEVDAALARCTNIKSAVSAAPQDSGGKKRLIAHVVPAEPDTFDERRLREELGTHLPVYMVPSRFICHEQLPVTDNGKVDHKALPNPWRDALEAAHPGAVEAQPVATPAAAAEAQPEVQLVAEPAAEREASTAVPSVQATPTELGISSLEIVRLANRIEDATGTRPALATLLNQPWQVSLAMCEVPDEPAEVPDVPAASCEDVLLNGLALGASYTMELPISQDALEEQFINAGTWIKQLREAVPHTAKIQLTPPTGTTLCTINISRDAPRKDTNLAAPCGLVATHASASQPTVPHAASAQKAPLTQLQVGYLVGRADLWLGESVTPHYYTEVELSEVDVLKLRNALAAVVEAHPALRLGISDDGQQYLCPESAPMLRVHDLRNATDPNSHIEKLRADAYRGEPDPVGKPWLQLDLVQLAEGTRLHLTIDMLFCDVIGAGILIRDLLSAYRGIALEPEKHTFLEYAHRLSATTQTAPNTADSASSRAAANAEQQAATILPVQPSTSGRFARERGIISADIAAGLRQYATQVGSTLDGLIATIVSTCAGLITESGPQPIVATVLARPEGFENTIGEFTSTVRVQPHGDNLQHRARSATETLLAATDRAHRCISEPHPSSAQVSPIVYSSGLNSHGDQSEVLAPFGQTLLAQSWTSQVLMDVQVFWRNNGFAVVVDHAIDALQPGAARALLDAITVAMTHLATSAPTDPASVDGQLRSLLPAPSLQPVAVHWDAFGTQKTQARTSHAKTDEVADALRTLLAREITTADYDSGFFDLGATSTDLMQLRNALVGNGHTLTLLDVFAHPSINSLGELLAGHTANPSVSCATPIRSTAPSTSTAATARRRGQQRRRIALAMNGAQ